MKWSNTWYVDDNLFYLFKDGFISQFSKFSGSSALENRKSFFQSYLEDAKIANYENEGGNGDRFISCTL